MVAHITFTDIIERVVRFSEPEELMSHGCVAELKSMRAEVQACTENVSSLSCQVFELKQQLEESQRQFQAAKCALRDITNEKAIYKNKGT